MTITLLAPDGVAVTAQQERQARAAGHGGGSGRQLGARSGFRVGTPSNVLTATSTTWTLSPCSAMLDPGASLHQGAYGWSSDANVTGSVTAADATYSRKDIVYIQVNDSSAGDGSGALTAPVLYLAGTASASPVAPTLPARSFLVGTITVPQAGGGSPTVVRNPAVYVAAGAVLPVYSQAERDALVPYVGLDVQRMDLTQIGAGGIRERWNGTTWDHFGHAEFTTPANTAGANAVWGMGSFTRDATPSTDDAFVTVAGLDVLRVRDTGLYNLTVMVSFTKPISGVSWLSIDGAFTVTMGGGLQNFVATLPNVRLTGGSNINPVLAHGSGPDDTGTTNRTFTSRVRVTRIA